MSQLLAVLSAVTQSSPVFGEIGPKSEQPFSGLPVLPVGSAQSREFEVEQIEEFIAVTDTGIEQHLRAVDQEVDQTVAAFVGEHIHVSRGLPMLRIQLKCLISAGGVEGVRTHLRGAEVRQTGHRWCVTYADEAAAYVRDVHQIHSIEVFKQNCLQKFLLFGPFETCRSLQEVHQKFLFEEQRIGS